MHKRPHRLLNIHPCGSGKVRVSVGDRVRGVVSAETDPIDFEKRPSWGVLDNAVT